MILESAERLRTRKDAETAEREAFISTIRCLIWALIYTWVDLLLIFDEQLAQKTEEHLRFDA